MSVPGAEPIVALAEVRDGPLSIDEVVNAVRHNSAGAIAVFVGQVRDHDSGRGVASLSYSCHPAATDAALAVAVEVSGSRPGCRVAVTHRVGDLAVGEVAIVVAASAAHRDDAFEVCRALVDAVKSRVPIWKHQVFTDGSQEWVGMP